MEMTSSEFVLQTTLEQKKAMVRLQERSGVSWREFVEGCSPPGGPVFPFVMVPWAGMWLGIEPDGHTHS